MHFTEIRKHILVHHLLRVWRSAAPKLWKSNYMFGQNKVLSCVLTFWSFVLFLCKWMQLYSLNRFTVSTMGYMDVQSKMQHMLTVSLCSTGFSYCSLVICAVVLAALSAAQRQLNKEGLASYCCFDAKSSWNKMWLLQMLLYYNSPHVTNWNIKLCGLSVQAQLWLIMSQVIAYQELHCHMTDLSHYSTSNQIFTVFF